jgi:hypothetical protein
MIFVGMLTNLQQTNLIPNFSTRTEMGSVRQKVGIKNWDLLNHAKIDCACSYNSRYVDPYGLDRYGLDPLGEQARAASAIRAPSFSRALKGLHNEHYGSCSHPRGAARLAKQAAFNFTTLYQFDPRFD